MYMREDGLINYLKKKKKKKMYVCMYVCMYCIVCTYVYVCVCACILHETNATENYLPWFGHLSV